MNSPGAAHLPPLGAEDQPPGMRVIGLAPSCGAGGTAGS